MKELLPPLLLPPLPLLLVWLQVYILMFFDCPSARSSSMNGGIAHLPSKPWQFPGRPCQAAAFKSGHVEKLLKSQRSHFKCHKFPFKNHLLNSYNGFKFNVRAEHGVGHIFQNKNC
jgi:hypothetical protein